MSSPILHFLNNRSPSLLDTITIDGVPADLTGATGVKLQMRPVGASTLKVNSSGTITSTTSGQVKYDWAAVDVDTEGFYVAWWQVQLPASVTQDTPEFLVEIREHNALAKEYVTVEELKSTLTLSGQGFADADIQLAVQAASIAIEQECGRHFYPGTPGEVRLYTPSSSEFVQIDDASAVTAVSMMGTALTLSTQYQLEPANAALNGFPYEAIWAAKSFRFNSTYRSSFSVTGTFGWPTVPPPIKSATTILASRLLRRAREAAFGVIGIGFDGTSVRISNTDPDLMTLLGPYTRSNMVRS